MKNILLIIMLILNGCVPETGPTTEICDNFPDHDLKNQQTIFPIKVSLADTFTSEEISGISNAINAWNTAVNSVVFDPAIEDANDHFECGHIYISKYKGVGPEIGHTSWDSCNALISIYVNIYEYEGALIHEFGHALNINHDLEDNTSIMYPLIHNPLLQTIKSRHIQFVNEAMNCWN